VRVPTRRLVVLAVAGALPFALALAGLFAFRDAEATPAYRGSRPPEGMTASGFRLKSYTGREVSLARLRGKVLALTFLDAQCKDACPVIAAVVPRARALLTPRERNRAVFVAISTDPREDTPAAVSAFLRRGAGAVRAQDLARLRRARVRAQRLGQPPFGAGSDLQGGR
jgi:protein SCO1/2